MDKEKAISFIEDSFLSDLLADEDVTDISYNGDNLYYVSNSKGRMKSDILLERNTVKDFIRQIANLTERQFSYTVPELDLSIGRYRINAMHQSIGKICDDGVITFSIRIASNQIRINDDSDFFTLQIVELVKYILMSKSSIVIGGVTGSGKTEFQKYLLLKLEQNTRIIVIDNVLELDRIRNNNLDLTCWQIDEKNPNATPGKLVKAALRNNPDWLILAEARDSEMIDVLNSAMTGMPIITTIHALDIFSMPHRMARMIMKGEQKLDFNDVLDDVYYHFHFYFYLKKEMINGEIHRYISSICYFDNNGKSYLIYENKNGQHTYYKFNKGILNSLNIKNGSKSFNSVFVGE